MDTNVIYCGDCLQELKDIPSESNEQRLDRNAHICIQYGSIWYIIINSGNRWMYSDAWTKMVSLLFARGIRGKIM